MGRYDDPNSATTSFSILLGDAPHLDEKARAGSSLAPYCFPCHLAATVLPASIRAPRRLSVCPRRCMSAAARARMLGVSPSGPAWSAAAAERR